MKEKKEIPDTKIELAGIFKHIFPAHVMITKDKIVMNDGKGNKKEFSIAQTRKFLEDFFR